jgi:hypothetical protein
MARKVTKRKDGFFSVQGLPGYYDEDTAKRVAKQMDAADAAQAKTDKQGSPESPADDQDDDADESDDTDEDADDDQT